MGFAGLNALSLISEVLDIGFPPLEWLSDMSWFLGGLVLFAALMIAFGSVVLTRFGTAESWDAVDRFSSGIPAVPARP